MAATRFTSSDPVADRRASYAEQLAERGDMLAAIEVLASALEIAPLWTAGWFRLGELNESAGQGDAAIAAWERALVLEPDDPFGASLKRDLARAVPLAESMPPAFVELLFDQYAPGFDAALVDRLGYKGPEIIMQRLLAGGFTRAARVLDLGCGTGLAGEVLRPRADWLEGFDISTGMLAIADAKDIYDVLEKHDIAQLSPGTRPYDLIVAADVFAYIGALEGVIGWCRASLAPEGILAFTVEAAAGNEPPVVLRESRRFAHAQDYLTGLLTTAGFDTVDIRACVVRQDRGSDIESFCVVASLPRVRGDRESDGEAHLAV